MKRLTAEELEALLLLCSRHTGNEALRVEDVPGMIRLRFEGARRVIEAQDRRIASLVKERDQMRKNWETACECGKEIVSENIRLRNVLAEIAENPGCGCMPCMGQCSSKDTLQIELEEIRSLAREAINR